MANYPPVQKFVLVQGEADVDEMFHHGGPEAVGVEYPDGSAWLDWTHRENDPDRMPGAGRERYPGGIDEVRATHATGCPFRLVLLDVNWNR